LSGRSFAVKKVFDIPAPDMAATAVSELMAFNHGQDKLDGKPMTIAVASGPYTLDDSLSFEPFRSLMDAMAKERPDLLILVHSILVTLMLDGPVCGRPASVDCGRHVGVGV
jgi:DNA polymerase alpha subunit B